MLHDIGELVAFVDMGGHVIGVARQFEGKYFVTGNMLVEQRWTCNHIKSLTA